MDAATSQAGAVGVAGPNLRVVVAPEHNAHATAVIMRFASYEAAQAILTKAGFTSISGLAHVLRHPDGRTAVRFADSDGSIVILAQPL